MLENGFVKLYRKIGEWRWYTNVPAKVLFLHLLLFANFKDQMWEGIEVKRGQYLTTIEGLAKQTGLTMQQVRTGLRKLETSKEIGKQSVKNRFTIVTVSNYELYQSATNQQQTADGIDTGFFEDCENPTTNQQQTNNKPITNQQQTDNKPITMIEESNKARKQESKNSVSLAHFDAFWSAYPRKVGKQKARQAFEKLNVSDELSATILSAIEQQKKTWGDPQYIPYPATWLNQNRWEDEIEDEQWGIERTYDIHGWDDLTFENDPDFMECLNEQQV